MTKVEVKLYLPADLAGRVADAVNQFRAAGRRVSRNEVLEKLIEDGFRVWRREAQVVHRVEAGIDRLAEQSARHDKVLRSILLTLADGDRAEYRRLLDIIEKEDAARPLAAE